MPYGAALTLQPVPGSEDPVGACCETTSWRTATSFDGGNVRPGAPDAFSQFVLCPTPLVAQCTETMSESRTWGLFWIKFLAIQLPPLTI